MWSMAAFSKAATHADATATASVRVMRVGYALCGVTARMTRWRTLRHSCIRVQVCAARPSPGCEGEVTSSSTLAAHKAWREPATMRVRKPAADLCRQP